jgi:DNA-binding transcriptional LysR family regulator
MMKPVRHQPKDRAKRRRPNIDVRKRILQIRWDSLQILIAIYETGSLRGGALASTWSINAVRSHVQLVERALGGPIFLRSVNGVEFTELGHAALDVARKMQAVLLKFAQTATARNGALDAVDDTSE